MPRAEASNLLDAMRELLAGMPGDATALTITGVRRGGVWKVQGSVPVQRCVCPVGGVHHGSCPAWAPGRIQ